MLYPAYNDVVPGTSGMSQAPLLRMKYLNFVTQPGATALSTAKAGGLLGSSSGFNFAPAMDDAMFSDSEGNLYPKVVSLTCAFSVIHENPLGWTEGKKRTEHFPYGTISEFEEKFDPEAPNASFEPETPSMSVPEERRNESSEEQLMSGGDE